MQVTVRIYRQHDMDLVALYRTPGFKFQKVMREAVKAYAAKKDYHIVRPKGAGIKSGYIPKMVQMHIKLDPKEDHDAIKLLASIRYGYRSSFLKALFRKYMTTEPLDAYRKRDDLIFDAEMDYIEDHHPSKSSKKKDRKSAGQQTDKDVQRKDYQTGNSGNPGNPGKAVSSPKNDNEKVPESPEKQKNQDKGIHNDAENARLKEPEWWEEAEADNSGQTSRQKNISGNASETDFFSDEEKDTRTGLFDSDSGPDTGRSSVSSENNAETGLFSDKRAEEKKSGDDKKESSSSDDLGLFPSFDDQDGDQDDDYDDILKTMNSLAH